jgi:flagellar hook-associated protein 3 FlgL
MTSINPFTPRTSLLLTSDRLLSALRQTEADIATTSNQISTGKAVNKPSDAPASAATILLLQAQLKARDQHDQNLQFASTILDNTDQAMTDASNILLQAQSIGSSQIGIGSTTDTRANQATVIDQQILALLDIANRQQEGVSLFGGSTTPMSSQNNGNVFVDFLGGVRYLGSQTNLATDVGMSRPMEINSNGNDAFGGQSTRVVSKVVLHPQATASTLLADVAGAQGQGVRIGSLQLTVDGTVAIVDLTGAKTLGDVLNRLNDAVGKIDPTAGSLAVGGTGLSLTAAAGHTISIANNGASQTAADLGLVLSATGATAAGGDLAPRLTALTALAALPMVNFAGGLKISQGSTTKVADFSTSTTVQDLSNAIDKLGLGVKLEINSAGNGLNLVSQVSGPDLSVGEVAGGTTAGDLGLRTLGTATNLSDLNFGQGIHNTPGQDDFSVALHGGTTFNVRLDGATTVGDVIAKISPAAAAAGLTVGTVGQAGTNFNVGLAKDGNGLVMEDQTAGGGDFAVKELGTSLAAGDLGLYTNAGSGATINGGDVGKARADGIFTHLMQLRDALAKDDTRGITVATSAIEQDLTRLTNTRAQVGVRAQRVQQETQRSTDLKTAEQSMLENIQGADMTAVITRFTQLQQQLQASLQVGAKTMQTSLLDFLR